MNVIEDSKKLDKRIVLSTLWIFVLMNMIYADIIGMLRPGYLELLDRMSQELSPGTVLVFSALLEIPILMILLSRILERKPNRILNFVAVPISIIYVVFGGLDNPPVSYLFFGGVEIVTMLVIGYLAFKWPADT
ncbi:MAG: DUF6326 family protein [Pricia sp.]